MVALTSPYIREEWKDNVRNFKYRGTDNSIFYKYFTSPVCNVIVEYLPKSLAPNILTLIGLLCNISIFGITYYFTGFSGGNAVPAWACHLCSNLYFTYMMFDNLDGKQARRTGTSSPLGMMFDHGCDALTTFLFSMGLGSIIGLDSITWYTLIWLMIAFPFFLNTWEEYYTGELIFPIIHGVSEGTLIACFSMTLTGFLGLDFWLTKVHLYGYDLQYNHLAVIACFTAGIGFGTYSLINILINYQEKKKDAITNLFLFVSLLSSLVILVIFSDSLIVRDYPKVVILLYGFAFAKLVGHLQLAHICDSQFMQYRKSLLLSFYCLAIFSLFNRFSRKNIINIDYLILAFLALHVVVWMHFAYYLTEELCETLGIYRFTVKKRTKKE